VVLVLRSRRRLLQFLEAKDVHAQQAELATVTFLQQPEAFDRTSLRGHDDRMCRILRTAVTKHEKGRQG
jgi:hypothetical protein